MIKKIAIQGIKGSFHDEAANILFRDNHFKLVCCLTFRDLAKSVANRSADYGVMAIENSIAGALLPNYNLLTNYDLKITDELYMPIHHYLMTRSNQTIEKIKEVRSHPMALMQCENYFEPYPEIRLIEVPDTASAAKEIAEKNLNQTAAIASKQAAKVYGLNIIGEKIQTIQHNFTRFFVVQKNKDNPLNFNKVSVKLKVSHQSGSLARVLNQIAFRRINMSKIQSVPIIEEPWNYAFFIDLVLDKSSEFNAFVQEIELLVSSFKY